MVIQSGRSAVVRRSDYPHRHGVCHYDFRCDDGLGLLGCGRRTRHGRPSDPRRNNLRRQRRRTGRGRCRNPQGQNRRHRHVRDCRHPAGHRRRGPRHRSRIHRSAFAQRYADHGGRHAAERQLPDAGLHQRCHRQLRGRAGRRRRLLWQDRCREEPAPTSCTSSRTAASGGK